MNIYIIFPKRFFTEEQLGKFTEHDLKFIEGKNIDLEKIKELFQEEKYILAVDPTYLKDSWGAFPVERVKRMKGLKALCLTTTSYSWVDGKALSEIGITVTNTPGKSTEAVAEFNIYMMFSLLRKTPLIVKNNWAMDYDNFTNEEAKGLKAGIVGLGKIGTRVAELCRGLGMEVYYWNRSNRNIPFKSISLEELFSKADVIFNTIATAPELKGFLNKNLISRLNNKAVIVSTSDTHVFDVDLIFKQVEKNKLGGFAFESEKAKTTDFKGNVAVFPEQAYYTLGTLRNTARIVTETIISILQGSPINVVNK